MSPVWKSVAVTSALWAVVLLALSVVAANSGGAWHADERHGMPAHAWSANGHMGGGLGPAMMGQSEYGYLAAMVSHHQEAIDMARELRRSESPDLRCFGRAIESSQGEQVRLMSGWLAQWYPDRPAEDPAYRPEMRDLSGLSGEALDRAFLTDMIGHHMMAVMSSQRLLVSGEVRHPEVGDLAAQIRDGQHDEITWMAHRLDGDSGATPWPACSGSVA